MRPFLGFDYNRLAESGQALKRFVVAGAPSLDGVPAFFYEGGVLSGAPPLKETLLHKCHFVDSNRASGLVRVCEAEKVGLLDNNYTIEAVREPGSIARQLTITEVESVGSSCPSCREPLVYSVVEIGQSVRLCGRYMSVATCRNHHVFFKVLVCGQEWCEVCGEDDSLSHRRRISAYLPKAQQVASMGYLVVQASTDRRYLLRTREYRKWYFAVLKRVLKQFGIEAALWFWHLFGEKNVGSFNPHLNVLFEGGHVPVFFINDLREALRSEFRDSSLVVNYGFHQEAGQKYSVLKYCTRATFRSESWDYKLAAGLYGERRRGSFGKWDGEPVWEVQGVEKRSEAVEQLEAGLCPKCGEVLGWHRKAVSTNFLNLWETTDLGDGFFALADGGGEVRRGRVRLVR